MRRLLKPALGIIGIALLYSILRPRFEGDTQALLENADAALACLRAGAGRTCPEAGQFPLLQFFPALLLRWAGLGHTSILAFFSTLSAIAFAASLFVTWRVLSGSSRVAAILASVVLLSGFNLPYLNSTFSETLASFLILSSVAAIVAGRSGFVILLLMTLSAWSKETAAPFLILIAGLAAWPSLKPAAWAVAGVALGTAGSVALNFVRFGTWYNERYLDPLFLVHDTHIQLSNFLGLWLSPNGGLALLWAPFVLLVAICVFHRPRWIAAGVGLLLFGLTLGFSRWYSPFGWIGWGPRLFLPWIPALILLLCAKIPLERSVEWILARCRLAWSCAALVGLSGFMNFSVLLRRNFPGHLLDRACSPPAVIQENAARYWECLDQMIWPKRWLFPEIFLPWPRPEVFLAALAYALVLLVLMKELRRRPSPNASRSSLS